MKSPICLFLLAALWPAAASAVTINIDAEVLKAADGSPMGQSGRVILTAATSGVFSGPSGTNFTTGDEMLLASWDLAAWATDGIFSGSTGALSFSGLWDQGDALRLYWYPTLDLSATGPSEGVSYGFYSDPSGLDGGTPWVTPDESDTISLGFFTSDASFLNTGSNDPGAGLASLVVPRAGGITPNGVPVPDDGSTLLLLSVGLAGFVMVARRTTFRSALPFPKPPVPCLLPPA